MSVESMAAFARRLGVARSTVTRWAKAGHIELAPNGKVRVEESLRRLEQMQGARPDVAARHATKRGKSITAAGSHAEQTADASVETAHEKTGASPVSIEAALADYKAQMLKFRNSLTKLEIALERGDWLVRDAHNRRMGELGKRLRQSLENLADSLAPRMAAGLVDGAVLEAEVKRTVEEVLSA